MSFKSSRPPAVIPISERLALKPRGLIEIAPLPPKTQNNPMSRFSIRVIGGTAVFVKNVS